MFDEQNAKEPEDIFSATDPGAQQGNAVVPTQPGQIPPPAATPPPAMPGAAPEAPGGSNKKLVLVAIIIVIAILGLIAVLVGLWLVRRTPAEQLPAVTQQPVVQPTLTEEPGEDMLPAESDEAQPAFGLPGAEDLAEAEQPEPVDTDGDGLTDAEETALGTSIDTVDTDQDGLSDADEVRVWNTDPLNSDTDGDTFLDGAEVQSGYDPNQAGGILLNLPS